MKPGTNAPARPRYAGEYHVFRSPHDRDVLLVDRAEIRPGYNSLRWAAVLDDDLRSAIVAAHQMHGFDGIPHPHIRTSVLRQYAANLTGRTIERGERGGMSYIALGLEVARQVLNETAAQSPIRWAISKGLEADTPYLAEIEAMMVASGRVPGTTSDRIKILDQLDILRHGAWCLGLPDNNCPSKLIYDRLTELQQNYPALQKVQLTPPEDERAAALEPAAGMP